MKIFIGISGASGAELGVFTAISAAKLGIKTHLCISQGAKDVISYEGLNLALYKDKKIEQINQLSPNDIEQNLYKYGIQIHDDSDLSAKPSSGSYGIDAFILAPCSINSIAKIHAGFTDTLITRAAAVALKERKPLILGVREMPLSTLVLRQLTSLSELGAIIAPPLISGYTKSEMIDFIAGRWLDLAGIKNQIYKRWKE